MCSSAFVTPAQIVRTTAISREIRLIDKNKLHRWLPVYDAVMTMPEGIILYFLLESACNQNEIVRSLHRPSRRIRHRYHSSSVKQLVSRQSTLLIRDHTISLFRLTDSNAFSLHRLKCILGEESIASSQRTHRPAPPSAGRM